MDWLLHDNVLRHERVKVTLKLFFMTILVVAMQYKRQSFCLDTGETYTQSAKDKKIKNKGSAW